MPLPVNHDCAVIEQPLRYPICEPEGSSAVELSRNEQCRNRRSDGLAIALWKRCSRPEIAGSLLLSQPIFLEERGACVRGNILLIDERTSSLHVIAKKRPNPRSS